MSILRLSSWATKLDISHRSKLGHLAPSQSLTLANTIDFTESGRAFPAKQFWAPIKGHPVRIGGNKTDTDVSLRSKNTATLGDWNPVLYFQWASPTDTHTYIYIYIHIPTFDLAYIIAIYNFTHVLKFYLTYVLAFYLTHIQTLYIYISFYLTFSLTSYLAFYLTFYLQIIYLTYILTFHLALDLTYFCHSIILTFSLEWYLTVWYILSGLSGFYILFRSSEL